MVKHQLCIAISCGSLLLAGCAASGRPGSGAGAAYTPIVDTQNVDQGAYARDLLACRQFAGLIDAQGAAVSGAVTGAVLHAALSAAFGLRGRYVDHNAAYGAISGGTRAAAGATAAQQNILMNCLIGRGYRPLEVAGFAPIAVAAVAPPPPPVAATSTPVPFDRATSPPTADPIPAAGVVSTSGEYTASAERLARVFSCGVAPKFIARGAGFETYSMACTSSDPIMIRCDSASCREMK